MHLFASLAAHGWHPAAWRVSGQPGFEGAAPFLRAAKTAESGGLDAVLLGLPTVPRSLHLDPLPLLGLLIGATRHIGLCGYWPADVAEPFHVARVFATLDHLSGGRTGWIAGLAGPAETTGRFQRADLVALSDVDAAARFVELIDVARQLWDSWEDKGFVVDQATGTFADPSHVHPIEHAGRFFTVRGPLNVPRPVQGQPVIVHRDVPATRAALAPSADIVVGEPATLAEAKAARDAWQGLKQGARYVVRLEVILGETEAAAVKRAAELDALASDTRPRFVGTAEQLAVHLASWQAAGACDGVDILPAVMPLDLDLLVTAVVPLLRARGLRPAGYAGRTLREQLEIARPLSRFGSRFAA